MRILLVEDDHMLARVLLDRLEEDQNTVDWLDDGEQALNALEHNHFDLVVLDLTLPRLDGLDVVRGVRRQGNATPVIILTARADLDERLQGLDGGADDYLTKPFALSELKARIRAITRRGVHQSDSTLKVGQLELDVDSFQLSIAYETVTLSRSEFQILDHLMRHPDQVVTRRRLEEQRYGWDPGAESNALEVHIHHLRRRIGKTSIRTIRGVGYLLDSKAAARATGCP